MCRVWLSAPSYGTPMKSGGSAAWWKKRRPGRRLPVLRWAGRRPDAPYKGAKPLVSKCGSSSPTLTVV